MTGRIIEAELRITGSDKSGEAFAGVIKHARELETMLGGMKGLKITDPGFADASQHIKETTRLLNVERRAADEVRRSLALVNGELAKRATLTERVKGFYNSAAGQLGIITTGAAAGHAIRRSATDAADFEHQKALLAAGGMSPAEIKQAIAAAWKASSAVPTATAADSLKTVGELRTVFNSTAHAIENLQTVLRATSVLHALNPHMNAENKSYNLARALEIKGVSNDPAHFVRLANGMVQAMNATRGKVTGSEFFEFTKYAKGAAGLLSDDFYTGIAPTLIQELGGHSAGQALATFRQTLIGGKMGNRAADEFVRLGMVNPDAVIRTSTGAVKGIRPGGLVGSGLAQSNPFEWVQKVLKPSLDKAGITEPTKVSEALAHLFGNRNAESMASILLNQAPRITKDQALINGAPGAAAIDMLNKSDPKVALRDLGAAVTDFLAAVGDPLMKPAISGLNALAGVVRSISGEVAAFAPGHPGVAGAGSAALLGGAGYLGLKGLQSMFGLAGVGLNGSAAALTRSAIALDAAAIRLGGGMPGAPVAKPGIGGGWGRLGVGVGALGLGIGGAFAAGDYVSDAIGGDLIDVDPNTGIPIFGPAKRGPGHFTVDDIRSAMSGGNGAPIKAEVEGKADLNVKVDVSPSPDFLTKIQTFINNEINAFRNGGGVPHTGSSGSTGRSMPEASPGAEH